MSAAEALYFVDNFVPVLFVLLFVMLAIPMYRIKYYDWDVWVCVLFAEWNLFLFSLLHDKLNLYVMYMVCKHWRWTVIEQNFISTKEDRKECTSFFY